MLNKKHFIVISQAFDSEPSHSIYATINFRTFFEKHNILFCQLETWSDIVSMVFTRVFSDSLLVLLVCQWSIFICGFLRAFFLPTAASIFKTFDFALVSRPQLGNFPRDISNPDKELMCTKKLMPWEEIGPLEFGG